MINKIHLTNFSTLLGCSKISARIELRKLNRLTEGFYRGKGNLNRLPFFAFYSNVIRST